VQAAAIHPFRRASVTDHDVRLLDVASDLGVPYPKQMVLPLDAAEDPRPRHPQRHADGGLWKDFCRTQWSG
jgi:hypothetical protein